MRSVRRSRRWGMVLFLALILTVGCPGSGGCFRIWAAQETDPDTMSDEELNQLMEEYFKKIGTGEMGIEQPSSEKITDPPLRLSQERDGSLRYTLPNGSSFLTTAAQGMITQGPVDIQLFSGIMGVVRRDDVLDALPDSWHFTERGSYHIKFLSYQASVENNGDYNAYEVNFYFTIAGERESRLGAVPAPAGFEITEVWLDGKPLSVKHNRCLFLEEDGRYEIRYTDQESGQIRMETVLQKDTEAPFLIFSQELHDGEAEAPLEFTPSEKGCRIRMNYNGNQGYAVTNTLTAAGNYELFVEDEAGNQRDYHLHIRQIYDMADYRIFIAGILVSAGILIRLLFLRRNMRVV